jgi:hypothetical protein
MGKFLRKFRELPQRQLQDQPQSLSSTLSSLSTLSSCKSLIDRALIIEYPFVAERPTSTNCIYPSHNFPKTDMGGRNKGGGRGHPVQDKVKQLGRQVKQELKKEKEILEHAHGKVDSSSS